MVNFEFDANCKYVIGRLLSVITAGQHLNGDEWLNLDMTWACEWNDCVIDSHHLSL